MELFNATRTKLAALAGSLSVPARWAVGVAVIGLAVSLGYFIAPQSAEENTFLLEGVALSPSQLPTMEAAFAKAGLNDYHVEGHRICIPRARNSQYMTALAEARALPPNFGSIMENTLKQSSPLVNRTQQDEMIKAARQNELALIIQSMKGIETAAVFYDTQKLPGLRGGELVTASVMAKPTDNQPLEPDQIDSLRKLLSGAIAGLDPSHVTVTDLGTGRTYGAAGNERTDSGASCASLKRDFERVWTLKLRQSLEMIPHAIVTVNGEFDPAAGGGAAQSPSQRSLGPTAAVTNAAHPVQATVSVGIPASYVEQVWQHRHPAPMTFPTTRIDPRSLADVQAEIVANVQTHVRNLLPSSLASGKPWAKVAVTVFPDVATEMAESEADISSRVIEWGSQHALLLGPAFAACLGLVLLRSAVRRGPAVDVRPVPLAPIGTDQLATSGNRSTQHTETLAGPVAETTNARVPVSTWQSEADEPLEDSAEDTLARSRSKETIRRTATSDRPFRDDLAAVVRDDPRAAARVLINWMSSAR